MKCYRHRDKDAIAICKNCGKGLCDECAVEVGKGIACKSDCVSEVESINRSTLMNIKNFENNRKIYSQLSLWLFIIGIGFLIVSVFRPDLLGLSIFTAGVMFLGAIYSLLASKRYKTEKPIK